MIKYIFKSKLTLAITVIVMTIVSASNASLAFVMKNLIDYASKKDVQGFYKLMVIAFLLILTILIFDFLSKYFTGKFVKDCSLSLKKDLMSKILYKQNRLFTKENTATYLSIFNNDITIVKNEYFDNFLACIQTIIQFMVASISIFILNFYIALAIIILSLVTLFSPKITQKKLQETKRAQSDGLFLFTAKLKNILFGYEVVKNFNIEDKIDADFENINTYSENAEFHYLITKSFSQIIAGFFSYMMVFVTLSIATFLVIKNQASIGTFFAAIQLMEVINMPVISIASEIITFKSVKPIIDKIKNILDEQNDDEHGEELKEFNKSITFNNVCFGYNDSTNVINNVCFTISKGEKCAIIGDSGSGKSTILKLLLKYYTDYSGEILIDGINIKNINTNSLYRNIAIIQQNIFMFDSSVRDNICLFKNYTNEILNKVINMCGLSDLIKNLNYGVDTLIGENGSSISGGEKQKIAIARAIIKETPIIVLDEATSSIDIETAEKIEQSILNINNVTLITVTHRLSENLLKQYDKIIVVKKGKITQVGSYYDLDLKDKIVSL